MFQMQDSLQFGMMSSLKHAYGFKDPETIAWDQLQTEVRTYQSKYSIAVLLI